MQGPLKIDFEKLWQQGMHDWEGKMPERMTNDALEETFWRESIARKKPRQTDPHAIPIFEAMKAHIEPNDSVLEIGPGWGNYTFPLEAHAKTLSCVDSSASVLAYLAHHTNAQLIHGKFESLPLEAHDVVVGVNCFYRMYHMNATLIKMNALARKKAIIGMTTGPIQPHYEVLDKQFGYAIKYPRRDYIEILNMLYQLGFFADCQMLPLERIYTYATKEALLAAQSKKIIDKIVDRAHVEQALENFITYDGEQYHYKHRFYAAIISWTPQHEKT